MLKTLRITSWIVAVLAVVFCTFAVIGGLRGDEKVETFLKIPNVIESFKADAGKGLQSSGQASPLEKQARAFALYLNPPVETVEKRPSGGISSPRPTQVAAKFELFGTCIYPSEPKKSLAFIKEPGTGYRWVRQSQSIGHLLVQEVQEGLILLKDGEQITEMPVIQHSTINVINAHEVGKPGAPATIMPAAIVQPGQVKRIPAATQSLARRGLPSGRIAPQPRPERITAPPVRPVRKKPTKEQLEQNIDFARKFMADPEAMGISPEEAEKLAGLGEVLKDLESELKNLPPLPPEDAPPETPEATEETEETEEAEEAEETEE